MVTSAPALPFKRPPRPRGRDIDRLGLVELLHDFVRSDALIELCETLPHLPREDEGVSVRPVGRRPYFPPEAMVLFGVLTSQIHGDRNVERFLRDPHVWEPVRAHLAPLFPQYAGLAPGAPGPNRSQFMRWYSKIAEEPELLSTFAASFQASAIHLARSMDLFDPERRSPSRPDIRDTMIGDGTILKSRFRAAPGEKQVDRETGELVPRRFDPDATFQHRKGDDELIRLDVAGSNFGFLHGTTGEPGESIVVSMFHVPQGKGNSEAKSAMEQLLHLRDHGLPGISHLLYDKAMRGTHIDRAFAHGIYLHAKVSKVAGGKTKERMIDAQVEARRGTDVVGTVDIVAVGGAAHIRVPIADQLELIQLDPRQVRERLSRRTGALRVYRDYAIPDDIRVPERLRGAIVTVRHTSNEDDEQRGLKRTEVLRVIAETHDDWTVAAQRSRAESLNAQIKNRWQDKRAPAVGKERQLLRLLFAGLAINFQAVTTYDRRTMRVEAAPPPEPAAA